AATRPFVRPQKSGIHTQSQYELPDSPQGISGEKKTNLFRIIQELLTNVLKHSGATRITITLSILEPNTLQIQVKDNGRGIREEELTHPEAYGITGIRERCAYLQGQIQFHGKPGEGTEATLRIPL
ncbi:MAG: ATP-binding protein, partial [Spirochaetales bacterium]